MKSNWIRFLFSFVFIVLLSGCKANQPDQSPAAAAQPSSTVSAPLSAPHAVTEEDTRPVIIAFGDSLTAGYGTDAGQSYPDYLQHDLDARGYRYRVINEGVSGNTSKDGVVRLRGIVAQHPAVVIVAFGGNDGLRGLPIMDSQMNLETIISALKDGHAKVILGGITLPPNYGKEYIQKFNQMYQNQARDYHVPLLPFMLKGAYGMPGSMQNDGIHATAKGNQQVAKNFLPLLLPMLQSSSDKNPIKHAKGSTGHRHSAASITSPAQP